MPSSALPSLRRLRKQELEEAQTMLAAAQARAMIAADAVKIAEQNLLNEREAAMDFSADDHVVEAYSRWLPVGRAALERARGLEQDAAMEVEASRTRLTLARAAFEAVEKLMEIRRQEKEAASRRKEQNTLDDIAGRVRSASEPEPE
ncbi:MULTISPECIES: flagellar FliJ family protein [Acetobacter]|uniref:Flagellar FliJ protein n=1 Tax=Acetobacter sacchari TaxID=2661687 RepID=A0ABS3LQR5_9PROT|nr:MULTISPECIES: flagellar FliJ family protein [Acetobacter]MBO1358243.1 flagellar FliJ family protein [Acetobacter sacchari]OUJ16542.1 hypothetical protein HK28_11050 [Acetobacter sp. DsW_063]